MSLLDFIKNRGAQAQATEPQSQQQQAPENAKQFYTRQDAEARANAKAPDHGITTEQRAVVADVQTTMGVKSEGPEPTPPPTPAPGGAANPQPMQQQGIADGIAAPQMSPTSGLASSRAHDVEEPSAPASTPTKSQQTTARPTPSWER
jgi:hypothetical protein